MNKDKLYIIHILESISHINSFVQDGKQVFVDDRKTYDAVLRQLQIMSESTQRLTEELKAKYKNIPWREISGFRNILVHDYLGDLDSQIIWSIIENRLPQLKSVMPIELKNIGNH